MSSVATALVVLLFGSPNAQAQYMLGQPITFDSTPVLSKHSGLLDREPTTDALSPPAPNRLRLFRMPPGYRTPPVGLDSDDPPGQGAAEGATSSPALAIPASGPDSPLDVTLGMDNPYFDFRSKGDLGGIGYYKIDSQYEVFDDKSTSVVFNLQGATPAGVEAQGVGSGETVIAPSLAVFQELTPGSAFHCFFGNMFRANTQSVTRLNRSLRYGVAYEHTIAIDDANSDQSLSVFLEALGQTKFDDVEREMSTSFRIVPGIHCRLSEHIWVSTGVMLPVSCGSYDRERRGMWQFTCSWRY